MKIAVIPARGGSKRIPRKNLKPLKGKPLIAYSVDCAVETGLFDRVIVSTDDPEIAEVSQGYGAETPFLRPASLSDDHTGTGAVVAHAISFLLDQQVECSAVCAIYPTAPFIRKEDLLRGWELFRTGGFDFVFSATSFPSPIFRSFRVLEDGGLRMFFPEHYHTRSQDLPEALHDAGQFYWGRKEAWLDEREVFGQRSTVVRIPRWRVQDIDTEEDWRRAELISSQLGF